MKIFLKLLCVILSMCLLLAPLGLSVIAADGDEGDENSPEALEQEEPAGEEPPEDPAPEMENPSGEEPEEESAEPAEEETVEPEEDEYIVPEIQQNNDNELMALALGECEPNVILIKFVDPWTVPEKEMKHYDKEIEKVKKFDDNFDFIEALNLYAVKIEELEKNPNAVLNRFKNNKYIEFVDLNYWGGFEKVPNDPNYASRGSMYSKLINAEAGWDIITDSSVLIAVVDSGYSGNSDLPVANNNSYNVYNKNYDLTDKYGHGTQVAGTIGAIGNNNDKNVGIIWNATNLLPIKITESSSVTLANVAAAITYAADNKAKIINLSLSFTSDSATLKSAVDYAYNKGCIIVAATGNDSKGSVNYPAAYSNVLGIGGTADGTNRFTSSNYGNGLDLMASFSWYTTNYANNNIPASGTSIAAPQVTGLAALAWELAPALTNAQVMQLIRDNTNRADGKWDSQTGYGTIDMGKTLSAAKELGSSKPPEPKPEPATDAPKPEPTTAPQTEAPTQQPATEEEIVDANDLVTNAAPIKTSPSGQTKDNNKVIATSKINIVAGDLEVTALSGTVSVIVSGNGQNLTVTKTGKYALPPGQYTVDVKTGTFNGNMKWEVSFTFLSVPLAIGGTEWEYIPDDDEIGYLADDADRGNPLTGDLAVVFIIQLGLIAAAIPAYMYFKKRHKI